MAPSPPKPPTPPPAPPTIDQAAQQADASSLIRKRRGYLDTVKTGTALLTGATQTKTGTQSLLGA